MKKPQHENTICLGDSLIAHAESRLNVYSIGGQKHTLAVYKMRTRCVPWLLRVAFWPSDSIDAVTIPFWYLKQEAQLCQLKSCQC